ncbi:chitin deacetylase [Kappamyces sp. JEL0829]|nr:chitin deacetylase [Kappamyces sp. JEL0829]
MTFDDGMYQFTSDLLTILDNANAKATFFINGANYVDITTGDYPAILSRMYNSQHMVASHTYNHHDLSAISTQDAYEQLLQNDIVIKSIIGVAPRYVRPPYGGGINNENSVLDKLGSWGYKTVWLNLDSEDFANVGNANVLQMDEDSYHAALDNSNPQTDSFISLQHDPLTSTVHDFVPWAIDFVRNKGYRLVTVAECLGVSDLYRN